MFKDEHQLYNYFSNIEPSRLPISSREKKTRIYFWKYFFLTLAQIELSSCIEAIKYFNPESVISTRRELKGTLGKISFLHSTELKIFMFSKYEFKFIRNRFQVLKAVPFKSWLDASSYFYILCYARLG